MYFAVINASSSGSNEIVAAKAGRRIRVLAYVLVSNAAVVATWKSATTAISGPMNLAAAGYGVSASPGTNGLVSVPHLQTEQGEALNLSLGGAVIVAGHIVYEVTD